MLILGGLGVSLVPFVELTGTENEAWGPGAGAGGEAVASLSTSILSKELRLLIFDKADRRLYSSGGRFRGWVSRSAFLRRDEDPGSVEWRPKVRELRGFEPVSRSRGDGGAGEGLAGAFLVGDLEALWTEGEGRRGDACSELREWWRWCAEGESEVSMLSGPVDGFLGEEGVFLELKMFLIWTVEEAWRQIPTPLELCKAHPQK